MKIRELFVNSNRTRIIEYFLENGREIDRGELMKNLRIHESTLRRHLKYLKENDILRERTIKEVRENRKGRKERRDIKKYSLKSNGLTRVLLLLKEMVRER